MDVKIKKLFLYSKKPYYEKYIVFKPECFSLRSKNTKRSVTQHDIIIIYLKIKMILSMPLSQPENAKVIKLIIL